MPQETRNERLRRLFGDAAELTSDARHSFLAKACAAHPDIAEDLREMLALADSETSDQLGAAISANVRLMATQPPDIEGYCDFELIGEGGMGAVFRAQQTHPVRRTVAIKTIRTGVAGRTVLTRFAAERQALARMTHPGIAMMHDAGTDAHGIPYLVMEFVAGTSITEHCATNDIALEQRLLVFTKVCDAVEHAHRRGVLHRDIKPNNILVTEHAGDLHPKVIDFGIAKALEVPFAESIEQTMQGSLLGTLEYMSPEQLGDGSRVDTRSDIYALGVILYELLVGVRPLGAESETASITDWIRIVRDEVPVRPSRRIHQRTDGSKGTTDLSRLTRELDWVVMKALDKDPERRYQTPRDLADDVRRFLAHEPVEAGPPSELYRLRKFIRRHRGAAAGLVAVLLVLLGGWIITAHQAEQNRLLAVREKAARTTAQETSARLRENLYRSEMRFGVEEAGENPGLNAVRQLVERWRPRDGEPDLRGFEWHLLAAVCNQSERIAKAGGGIYRMQTQHDGTLLSTHMERLEAWDGSTGRHLRRWPVKVRPLGAMALSRDGRVLAQVVEKNVVQILDLHTNQELQRLHQEHDVLRAHLSDDGRILLTIANSDLLTVWDTADGKKLLELVQPNIRCAVSSDGSMFAVSHAARDAQVRLYRTGHAEPAHTLRGPGGEVGSLAFDAKGTKLATSWTLGALRVWSTQTGDTLLEATHKDICGAVAFHPKGDRLAVAGESSAIYVHDLTGGPANRLRGHDAPARGLAWSRDGCFLVSIAEDETMRWWRPGARRTRYSMSLRQTREVLDAQFSFDPSGNQLRLTSGQGEMQTWTLNARETAAGRNIGVSDPRLLTWEQRSQELQLPNYRFTAIAPKSRTLAFVESNRGALWIWPEHAERPTKLDGRAFRNPVWMHGNRIAVLHVLNEALLLDGTTGRQIATVKLRRDILSVSPHPRNETLALAGGDRNIHLWSPGKGVVDTLNGHGDAVLSVAFSPDGTRLASGGADRTVRVWDCAARSEVAIFRVAEHVPAVCWSPDGTRLAALTNTGTAIVWDTRNSPGR